MRYTPQQALDFIAGTRMFLTTRERIKQPEGVELFDEAIAVLTSALSPTQARPEVIRPERRVAELVIDGFLARELGEVPSYTLTEDGDPETADPNKVGWAFWIEEGDTTSYLHNDLTVEWYGTSWEQQSDEPAPTADGGDDFNGDNEKLVGCINALLSLDKAGALAPHGIGGHARTLLAAAAHRLTHPAPKAEVARLVEAAKEVADWPDTDLRCEFSTVFADEVVKLREALAPFTTAQKDQPHDD